MILLLAIFIISLAVLLKSSELFTTNAEKIGLSFGLPRFIIGVTIVAIGTSLPELISSALAVLKGSSEIVAGNVIGSNITNIFLILGVAALLSKRIKISYEIIRIDLPFLVGSAFLLFFIIFDGTVTIFEGLVAILGMSIYLIYTVTTEKQHEEEHKHDELCDIKENSLLKEWILLIASGIGIYFGAEYTINSIIELSQTLNIGTDIIAMTAVALGTSLPELMVTIDAVRRGKPEITIGNILGSNIFNAFAVIGIPTILGNLTISEETLNFGAPFMLGGTLLYFFITQDKEITKWEGSILILFYIFFLVKILT